MYATWRMWWGQVGKGRLLGSLGKGCAGMIGMARICWEGWDREIFLWSAFSEDKRDWLGEGGVMMDGIGWDDKDWMGWWG